MEKIDTRETLNRLLSLPAKDSSGAQVVSNSGDMMTYHEALCYQIIQKGFKDAGVGLKVLQEAGLFSKGSASEKDQKRDDAIARYEEQLKKKKAEVKKYLKKSGTEDPAIEMQIELTARDWIAYERACQDYVVGSSDTEEQRTLSEQMRKWSSTVRDDLAKLTMNVKDSERDLSTSENDVLSNLFNK